MENIRPIDANALLEKYDSEKDRYWGSGIFS